MLDKKANALKLRFRDVMKQLIDNKKDLGEKYENALLLLAKTNYATGNLKFFIKQ